MDEKDREFFRVELGNKKCEVELFKGFEEAIVRDMSAKGISLYMENDIDEIMFTNAYVSIDLDEPRELDIRFVKKEKINPIKYIYSFEFEGVREETRTKLVAYLLKEEIELKNQKKEEGE